MSDYDSSMSLDHFFPYLVATWSYFDPRTWFGYGYGSLGSASSAPPTAPAAGV